MINHPLSVIIALWAFAVAGIMVTSRNKKRAAIIILVLTAADIAITFLMRGTA